MCLVVLALDPDPDHRLVLVANRDERYARSTRPASEWEDVPGLIAGRDLHGGGTWLGVTHGGRFAAVTNFHEPRAPREDAPSRGELVTSFLEGSASPEEYLLRLRDRANAFNGFNLLAGDPTSTFWFSNRSGSGPTRLAPGGVYGLSNHLLDTPWPKVTGAKRRLEALLAAGGKPEPSRLLDLLHDRRTLQPAPGERPMSELERAFSAPFIVTPEYGTRSTTALVIGNDGGGVLAERTYERGSFDYEEVLLQVRR
jgi:uncharacterized protein with NRDE domain